MNKITYGVQVIRPEPIAQVLPPPPPTLLERLQDAVLWYEVTRPALLFALAFTCLKWALMI